MKKIIVIGAGASGIMAAVTAARNGCSVTVLEQNAKPLKKLLLTGNGRCNLTNLDWNNASVIRGGNAEKALGIISRFDCREVIEFFSEIGIRTKERDGWVYPVNDSAAAVAKVLMYEAERLRIKIKTNQEAVSVEKTESGFTVRTRDWHYEADAVIISVGSPAQAEGSGCGIALETAKKFGLEARKFAPAVTALKSSRSGLAKWSGVRADGEIALICGGEEIARSEGQLQLTEYGISGIPVFEISRYAVEMLEKSRDEKSGKGRTDLAKSNKNAALSLKIDFLPEMTLGELRECLEHIKQRDPSRSPRMILLGFVNERLAEFIASQYKTAEECICALKEFIIPITGFMGLDKAQACMGGVDVNSLTDALEAKSCGGLYFTGEAVDVDGKCGGYNLQWAWSSGHAAGRAASGK